MSARAGRPSILRMCLIASAVTGALLVALVLYLTRPFPEPVWVEASNPVSIYQHDSQLEDNGDGIPVVSPFHLQTDPMQSLLLINFEQDPDSVYVGFEPQSFDDEIHGRGMLVLGWRRDGRVDVFHEPAVRLNPRTYAIAGQGLHLMAPRLFDEAAFELGPGGAHLHIAFHDLEDRRIQLVIRETDERPRNAFGLLAPMGSDTANPPALPLVHVDGFYFVRRAGSEVRINIDGRVHRSDRIPLILDGARVHFLRYSMDPFIAFWNPDWAVAARVLEPSADPTRGGMTAFADGVHYDLVSNGSFTEIQRMLRRQGSRTVRVDFSPALPHLLALAEDVVATGDFRVTAQPAVGSVTGHWRVAREGNTLHLKVRPEGGWTPGPVPRMARLLFRGVSMFREWPATYVWQGRLEHPAPDAPADVALAFESSWQRVAP